MVHHATSARNEVGRAFFPVRLNRHPRLADTNRFSISHFSFLIFHLKPNAGGS
jgi:hypothetical protein